MSEVAAAAILNILLMQKIASFLQMSTISNVRLITRTMGATVYTLRCAETMRTMQWGV